MYRVDLYVNGKLRKRGICYGENRGDAWGKWERYILHEWMRRVERCKMRGTWKTYDKLMHDSGFEMTEDEKMTGCFYFGQTCYQGHVVKQEGVS